MTIYSDLLLTSLEMRNTSCSYAMQEENH